MGIRSKVSRSTLADANEKRDSRIYADFAQLLIHEARKLYVDDDFGLQLKETVYAFDAIIVDLCLSVFPWARFRKTKAGIKLHTLLDLRGNIPSFIEITAAKIHEVKILDELIHELGAIDFMDRAFLEFERLYKLHQCLAFFVARGKVNTKLRHLYSMPIDRSSGLRYDKIVAPIGFYTQRAYPEKLQYVEFFNREKQQRIRLLTNQFTLPAITVADLYRCRWQVESFFRWMKEHLRIKSFCGTSENGVKSQIWIAVSVYVLAGIIKKRFKIDLNLFTMLQIFSLTLFERRMEWEKRHQELTGLMKR